MSPEVSIIICTCDRPQSLRATLEAIGRVDVPADLPAELLVIDNGASAQACSAASEAALPHIPLRCLREPRRGKGYAYNTGITAAQGAILLFTDDDVRPPPGWIEGMCRPIARGEADAVAGGVVFPAAYEKHLSKEPYRSRRAWFASTEELDAARPGRVVGANMAFSRRVFEKVGQFDVALGPGAMGFFDETLLGWQMEDRGLRMISRFDVAVEHHFDLSRLDRRSLLAMARRMGRSEAYVRWHWLRWEPPAAKDVWRSRLALLALRLVHPIDLLANRPADWELKKVRLIAFRQQMRIECKQPRKYVRLRAGQMP